MEDSSFFIEAGLRQFNCHGERISGDSFHIRRSGEGGRTVAILSDGMGHGAKASILSNLTSTMLLNMVRSDMDIVPVSEMIAKTLPICSIRKISYSTFTMVDVDHAARRAVIAEHDNPSAILLRGGDIVPLEWSVKRIERQEGMALTVRTAAVDLLPGDRIVFCTDGITQSGQRTRQYRFGWGEDNMREFIRYILSLNAGITPQDLADQIVSKGCGNDGNVPADDMSCVVLEARPLKSMVVISCPPALREQYAVLEQAARREGTTKVICGYPVAGVIGKLMGKELRIEGSAPDPALPPYRTLDGFDLVTEGIVTLTRTLDILEHGEADGPVHEGADPKSMALARLLRDHDRIEFIIGTARQTANDAAATDEFELRRNVLRRIVATLEVKYRKPVEVTYL